MPRIIYRPKNFHDSTMEMILQAQNIINNYKSQGYTLTLRQLYYQFVSKNLIANKEKEYNRLQRTMNDARLAGYIDWTAIEDRTRSLTSWRHFDSPEDAIEFARRTYEIDKWQDQPYYVEVWVEKDALVGVLNRICGRLDIPYFSCRGYSSASEIWKAAQRLGERKYLNDKKSLVLYLGDHDPSGIDMSRDIELRLNEYAVPPEERPYGTAEDWIDPDWADYMRENEWPIQVKRIALNMDQIKELDLPPNPAKLTDSRASGYIREYGYDSWELDALDPTYISDLIEKEIKQVLNQKQWREDQTRQAKDERIMNLISNHYHEVEEYVEDLNDEES